MIRGRGRERGIFSIFSINYLFKYVRFLQKNTISHPISTGITFIQCTLNMSQFKLLN